MKDSTITENIDIQQCWNRIRQAQVFKSVSYPVWKYLQGQNVEAVVDRQREVLCDVLLASSLEAEDLAFLIYWHGASQTLGRGFLKDWDRSLNF
ncbi:hypothetical protein [Duodenibacillus massiliensis]|uniref:hypothetical protein n=1 Tax=Duodenibacillus massiliensis TaxID=1852381 RepID=UPI0023A8B3D8|nr:hypothetical protein [Duodenibacillus massiliensis]